MDVTSYILGKKAGGGGSPASLQNKSVTVTTNGTQDITADVGYDGLKKVALTTNVEPDLQTKNITITENGTRTVINDIGYDGLEEVNITTNVTPNTQTKSITITENTTTTVTPDTNYDGLSQVEITTNVSGGSGGLDWSAIGYSETPQSITDGYNYALQIKNSWVSQSDLRNKFNNDLNLVYMPLVDTSIAAQMQTMFSGAIRLAEIALLNTTNVTSFSSLFNGCISLTTIPILNTSSVTNMYNMIAGCISLTDDSLDNILQMCINATNYTQAKTLYRLGISTADMQTIYPTSRIESLPHYQDFINAGWTIGY
jgi:surface protein